MRDRMSLILRIEVRRALWSNWILEWRAFIVLDWLLGCCLNLEPKGFDMFVTERDACSIVENLVLLNGVASSDISKSVFLLSLPVS